MKRNRSLLLGALAYSLLLHGHAQAQAAQPSLVHSTQEGFVDANGVMIYYVAMGHGKPLVVLHGGPGATHEYFLPYLLPLMRTNRLIFLDERGSGHSEKLDDTPEKYTVDAMADDVEAVRKALGLGRINLLGHSCGGTIAQAYALRYGGNLDHLILNSTFASTTHMNRVLAEEKNRIPADKLKRLNELEQAGLFGKGDPWERNRYPVEYQTLAWGWGYFPMMFGKHPDPAYDPSTDAPDNWLLYRTMWGSHGEFVIDGNMKSVEYVDQLSKIHVPTLILAGDHDEIGPELSDELHKGIAGSEEKILPDSGHMNFVDQQAMYNETVAAFLAK